MKTKKLEDWQINDRLKKLKDHKGNWILYEEESKEFHSSFKPKTKELKGGQNAN